MYQRGDRVLIPATVKNVNETDNTYMLSLEYGATTWIDSFWHIGKGLMTEKDIYNRGLHDAWELTKKIASKSLHELDLMGLSSLTHCAINLSYEHALAKIQEYESKMLEVGDIVHDEYTPKELGVITRVYNDDVYVLWSNGSTDKFKQTEIIKSGCKIAVEDWLKLIAEGGN